MTGEQLAKEFEKYLNEGWGYVYGAQGELYSKALAEKWRDEGRNPPNSGWNQKTYFTEDCKRWYGHHVADCSGSIVYAIQKKVNGFKDRNANTFRAEFKESGTPDKMPEIRGLALWYAGHIGVYVGNGYAIEFRGTNYGCVKTKVSERPWARWGKIKELDYTQTNETERKENMDKLKIESPLRRGTEIKNLQLALTAMGYACGTADGILGQKTLDAVKSFSADQLDSATIAVSFFNKTLKGNLK